MTLISEFSYVATRKPCALFQINISYLLQFKDVFTPFYNFNCILPLFRGIDLALLPGMRSAKEPVLQGAPLGYLQCCNVNCLRSKWRNENSGDLILVGKLLFSRRQNCTWLYILRNNFIKILAYPVCTKPCGRSATEETQPRCSLQLIEMHHKKYLFIVFYLFIARDVILRQYTFLSILLCPFYYIQICIKRSRLPRLLF